MEEIETFAGMKRDAKKDIFEKAHKKLTPRDRLFVVTNGCISK